MQEREQQQLKKVEQLRQRIHDQGLNPIYKMKTKTDQNFILSSLKNHFIFYNLSTSELDNVKNHMFWCEVSLGDIIFGQGSTGTCFFIIASGIVNVNIENQNVKELKAGEGFGQLALLYDIDRPSTVIAQQNTCFWVIDKTGFREAVEEIVIKEFQQNQKYLEGIAFYQFLPNSQKEKIASSFVTLKYYKGQNIVQEGDPGSAFYIIKEGTASAIKGNVQERKIYAGQSFGLNSLYYNTMRSMTIKAQEDVTCNVLGRQTLSKIIGVEQFRQVMFRNYTKHILQNNRQLFNLMKKDQKTFFQNMRIHYYKTNQRIFKKGTSIQKLVIIIEGRIKKFRSANFLAQSGQMWGESLLNINDIRLQDDIIAQKQSVLIEISFQNIRSIPQQPQYINIKQKQKLQPQLHLFEVIGVLSTNQTHNILLLQSNKKQYILKQYFNIQNNNTILIHQILEVYNLIQHPFIPENFKPLHINHSDLIITEALFGQSLYNVIRLIGLLSTIDCQFYVASMILILEYTHLIHVVIRDLKPDNFIVDQNGYLYLISLGSSKCIKDHHRTSTVIGTPHYMAPQCVLGKQYDQLVDLWAVGVMFYQFMVGQLPFGAFTQNPYSIYQEIIQGAVVFPKNFKDRRAKKLIEEMLSLNPQLRHNGSIANLKGSSWFDSINWEDLLAKKVPTPFKPNATKRQLQKNISKNLVDYLKIRK